MYQDFNDDYSIKFAGPNGVFPNNSLDQMNG